MQYTEEATAEIKTWYRYSTDEWVADINYKANKTSATVRYTGHTRQEARNAAFASVGHELLKTTYKG